MTDVEMRTIEVQFSEGQLRRMTFPASWKVTFGAIVPSERAGQSGGYGGWGLRIYESATKQCAVFTGVQSFYDLSVKQEVAAIRKYGTDDWYADDGSWTEERGDLVETKWINIEEVEDGRPPYYEEGLKQKPDEESDWNVVPASAYALRGLGPRRRGRGRA